MPSPPVATFRKQLEIAGQNASILPVADGYIGLVRNTEFTGPNNFSVNTLGKFKLDKDFNSVSYTILEDTSGRTRYKSWTTGPEDPRMISDTEAYVVTCDTNDRWKPEISKIQIQGNAIVKVQPQWAMDLPRGTEKNWLLLNQWGSECHFLQSTHPFRFVRINDTKGEGNLFLNQTVPGVELIAHNGAAVALEDGFLISARIKSGYSYKHSVWILLDRSYKYRGVSPPFRFEPEGWLEPNGSYRVGGQEMNMSLHLEGPELVCCVGVSDKQNIIVKYLLADVLAFVQQV